VKEEKLPIKENKEPDNPMAPSGILDDCGEVDPMEL
jgi:hypothetical protein